MEEKIHGSSENRSTKKALSIDGEIINMNDNELWKDVSFEQKNDLRIDFPRNWKEECLLDYLRNTEVLALELYDVDKVFRVN